MNRALMLYSKNLIRNQFGAPEEAFLDVRLVAIGVSSTFNGVQFLFGSAATT